MCRRCFGYLTTVRRDRIGILRTTGPVARIGGNNPPPGRLRIEYGVGVRAPAVLAPRATRRARRSTLENYDPFGFVRLTSDAVLLPPGPPAFPPHHAHTPPHAPRRITEATPP